MKSYSPAKKLSRTAARNALLLNQLATPGLGSIAARRWLAGLGQLAVFLAGFCIFAVWAFQQFNLALALWSGADPAPAGSGHPGVLGFSLAAIAWLWALGTSLQILREAKTANAAVPPPVLAANPAWQKNGEVISRRFEFVDFPAALNFVNGVARLAEQAQHHPDIDIRWNKVTLALTTHDAGGLTDKDYSLALACDELYLRQQAATR